MEKKKGINKKTTVVISVVIFSFLISVIFSVFYRKSTAKFLCEKKSYFYPVEVVKYSSQNIPCISVQAENQSVLALFDLGSGGLSLMPEVLEKIPKKLIGAEKFGGFRGKGYESKLYEVPKLEIGNIVLYKVKVSETNYEFEKDTILSKNDDEEVDKPMNRIGWQPFYGFNVLLDFSKSMIAHCDSLKTLKVQGYPVDSYVEVPFMLDRGMIEFDAVTEKGPLRCMLDTGCTKSLLNKDLENGHNEHIIYDPSKITAEQFALLNPFNTDYLSIDPDELFDISAFNLGEVNFGPVSFIQVKMPAQIEATIGMDFIEDKQIFIDFLNRKLYFLKS